jgi:UDP-N-acetylglucosamine 2-epimerase (non-hydrolysing)
VDEKETKVEIKRVLTVIGTRPEAIKLAPVVRELARRPDRFQSRVCVTGQHRELLDQAMAELQLESDHDLDVMRPDQSLAGLTTLALERLDRLMADTEPDIVLVQGDTTTALAGALAGFYRGATVGHVEAGLRTGNPQAPYPEEMNRRLIADLADLHFAPTEAARSELLREGVPEERIRVTGNTGIDSLLWMRDRVDTTPPESVPPPVRALPPSRPLLLVTGHRRESFDGGLAAVCEAVRAVADAVPDLVVVYPVHLNPRVQATARAALADHGRIHLVEPVGYAGFVWLLNRATTVLSDSGGVQEEAPALGTPLLVTREETERLEGVAAGSARLVGHDPDRIEAELIRLLTDPEARAPMAVPRFPFGDGTAARRIADMLEQWPQTGSPSRPAPAPDTITDTPLAPRPQVPSA